MLLCVQISSPSCTDSPCSTSTAYSEEDGYTDTAGDERMAVIEEEYIDVGAVGLDFIEHWKTDKRKKLQSLY